MLHDAENPTYTAPVPEVILPQSTPLISAVELTAEIVDTKRAALNRALRKGREKNRTYAKFAQLTPTLIAELESLGYCIDGNYVFFDKAAQAQYRQNEKALCAYTVCCTTVMLAIFTVLALIPLWIALSH